jgi:hemerythrin-like metal-binding protein
MGGMSLFTWSSAQSVYLPEIDAEHRAIHQLGNELHKALLAGAQPAQLKPILVSLLESAEQHFRHEERLMDAMHYTALAWHQRQHDAARKKAKALSRRIEAGDSAAACELLNSLSDWLRDHMGVSDRMMGAYLRNFLRYNTALAS